MDATEEEDICSRVEFRFSVLRFQNAVKDLSKKQRDILVKCGNPGLPIRNTRYAYNSRSHDQCVVNPHIRVDNGITSSITILNNILTIGHMTKYDIATQGKSTTKQRIASSVDDPCHAYYPTGN
jgi:hypothetical protein